MINLTAKIELLKSGVNDGKNGILSGISIVSPTLPKNNVSAEIYNILNAKKRVKHHSVYGNAIWGNERYTGELDYFVGSILSAPRSLTKSYEFSTPYTIVITGKDIEYITISFDDLNGCFPKTIRIDGTTYSDNDATWTLHLEKADSHTIVIDNWNAPKSPLVISGIFIDLIIDINKFNLKSIDTKTVDRADTSLPSYGIMSNGGNIEFYDTNGEISDYAEMQILKNGLKASVYLNNTLAKSSQLIAELYTDNWEYDSYNKLVKVSLKDDLEEWQEINIAEFYFDLKSLQSKTLKYFYEYLYERTPLQYNMMSFDELDYDTQDILENTIIRYPYLEKGTLWQQWTKLCEVAQLHIYKDNNRTICRYNGGN